MHFFNQNDSLSEHCELHTDHLRLRLTQVHESVHIILMKSGVIVQIIGFFKSLEMHALLRAWGWHRSSVVIQKQGPECELTGHFECK